jgi:small redox-active disulfide protein 2
MDIQVLGHGCTNCDALEEATRTALRRLDIDAPITKVTDDAAIAAHGVLTTPALVIDGRVVVSGRVPTVDEIARHLTPAVPAA